MRVALSLRGSCFEDENKSQSAFVCFYLAQLDTISTVCPLRLRPFGNQSKVTQRKNLFMAERWLSVEEIAAHLGVNRDTIYKWIDRKKMPAHKVGRLWKFLASEIDAWVKKGEAGRKET